MRGGLSKDAFHETRVQVRNEGSDESHLLSRVFEDDPGTQMEGGGERERIFVPVGNLIIAMPMLSFMCETGDV